MAAVATSQRCAHCGCAYSAALQRCSRCRQVWYCDTTCQRAAWPGHRRSCAKAIDSCTARVTPMKEESPCWLLSVLGLSADAAQVAVKAKLSVGRPDSRLFADKTLYLSWPLGGLSLCLEWGVVAAVHVFSAFADSLPHGLRLCMTNAQVVVALGEPADKGGGRLPGDAIWIRYPAHGLQIEFAGTSWAHTDLAVASVVIFAPDPLVGV